MIYDSEDISETYTQQSTLYVYIYFRIWKKKSNYQFISIYLQFSYFPIFKYPLTFKYYTKQLIWILLIILSQTTYYCIKLTFLTGQVKNIKFLIVFQVNYSFKEARKKIHFSTQRKLRIDRTLWRLWGSLGHDPRSNGVGGRACRCERLQTGGVNDTRTIAWTRPPVWTHVWQVFRRASLPRASSRERILSLDNASN